MAEDDKYVPSGGNKLLDPSYIKGLVRSSTESSVASHSRFLEEENKKFSDLAKQGLENQRRIADFNADQDASRAGLLNKRLVPEGYEIGDGGVLRNKGYNQTKGYLAKETTKMQRAHITERTWGKYNRGETTDMYGNKPSKKSDINASMSPNFGKLNGGPLLKETLGADFAGIMGWIGRFPPNVCGPALVMAFSNKGGYIQSNVQEASNNGRPIKVTDSWA